MPTVSEIIRKNQALITLILFALIVFYAGSFFNDDEQVYVPEPVEGADEVIDLLQEIQDIEIDIEFLNKLSQYQNNSFFNQDVLPPARRKNELFSE